MNIARAMAATLAAECSSLSNREAECAADGLVNFIGPPYGGQVVVIDDWVDGKAVFRVAFAHGMVLEDYNGQRGCTKPHAERSVINVCTATLDVFDNLDDAVAHAAKLWDNNPIWTPERTKGFYSEDAAKQEEEP